MPETRTRRAPRPAPTGQLVGTIQASALVCSIVGSVLALGGQPVVALFPILFLSIPAVFSPSAIPPRGTRIRRAFWILLGLSFASGLQAIPLPLGVLTSLSPRVAETWLEAKTLMAVPPNVGTLSLDPGASSRECLKWAAYAATLVIAANVTRAKSSSFVLLAVTISASLVGAITILHEIFEASTVFGFYKPTVVPPSMRFGPLLNPNNLAGYEILGAFTSLALRSKSDTGERKLWFSFLAALLFANAFLCGSRGATLSIAAGLVCYLIIRKGSKLSPKTWVAPLAFVVLTAYVSWIVSRDFTFELLRDKDLSKLDLFRRTLLLISDSPIFGIGRGAFESAFSAHRAGRNVAYSHAENFVLQWVVEWGVLGLFALVALAFTFRPGPIRNVRGSSFAFAGVVALAFQNLADLSFELPAFPIATLSILASIFVHSDDSHSGVQARRIGVGGLAVCATMGVALFFFHEGRHSVHSDRATSADELKDSLESPNTKGIAFRKRMFEKLARHPADPFFAQVFGEFSTRTGSRDALHFLAYALRRCPECGQVQLTIAIFLAPKNRNQALEHLGRAIVADPDLAGPVFETATRWNYPASDGLTLVPKSAQPEIAEAFCRAYKDDAACAQAIGRAVASHPNDVRLRYDFVERLIAARSEGPCSVPGCDANLELEIERLHSRDDSKGYALLARAALLERRGDAGSGVKELAAHCEQHPKVLRVCMRRRIDLAAKIPGPDALDSAAEFASRFCVSPSECNELMNAAADAFAARNQNEAAAFWAVRSASALPTLAGYLKAATISDRAGRPGQALVMLKNASALAPENPEVRAMMARFDSRIRYPE